MIYRHKVKKAEVVLGIIEEMMSCFGDEDCYVYMYSNGREQGYALTNDKNRCVCFSENRNSDQIVVYPGTGYHSDKLSEEQYKNRVYFDHDDYARAAKFIVKFMKGDSK